MWRVKDGTSYNYTQMGDADLRAPRLACMVWGMASRLDGQLVRKLREGRGLSQQELGILSKTSTRTVVRIELEGGDPKASAAARIAKALGVSIDSLFTEKEAVA